MRMNVAQEAGTVVSANRLVNVFGPTGFKAHMAEKRGLNIPIN